MLKPLCRCAVISCVVLAVCQPSVFAWGGRGHHAICSSAVHLVKNKELKSFLQSKPQILGYLCNIPDTGWRSLPKEQSELGNPSHYINPEALNISLEQTPLDFKKAFEAWKKLKNISDAKDDPKLKIQFHEDLGGLWWRAEQFYNLSSKELRKLKTAKDSDKKIILKTFLTYLGLMGHFIGDVSQPYHSTKDYDGFKTGHGGIHIYYEEDCVAEFSADLENKIFTAAQKFQQPTWIKNKILENMKELSKISLSELPQIEKLDPLMEKSGEKDKHGISKKAERKSTAEGYKVFHELIETELARSAVLLAHSWDEIFEKSGSPDFKIHGWLDFPHQPEFIPPDYF